MTPERMAHETDSAVEQLLLKSNGRKKTVQDVFEVVVAMNHDRRADTIRLLSEIKENRTRLDEHLTGKLHWTATEFAQFMDGRDDIVSTLEKDINAIKENCLEIHTRAPRRKDDPESEDWGKSVYGGDEEMGDMKRAWRVLKWVVLVVGGTFLVAAGNELANVLFGG